MLKVNWSALFHWIRSESHSSCSAQWFLRQLWHRANQEACGKPVLNKTTQCFWPVPKYLAIWIPSYHSILNTKSFLKSYMKSTHKLKSHAVFQFICTITIRNWTKNIVDDTHFWPLLLCLETSVLVEYLQNQQDMI